MILGVSFARRKQNTKRAWFKVEAAIQLELSLVKLPYAPLPMGPLLLLV